MELLDGFLWFGLLAAAPLAAAVFIGLSLCITAFRKRMSGRAAFLSAAALLGLLLVAGWGIAALVLRS